MREVPPGAGAALSAVRFGAWLKQNRGLRELSLDEVATLTRLPVRLIEALENGEPGTDRGHALLVARSCATAIGLDPEETALRLEEELQESDPPAPPRPPLWKRAWAARPREPLVWIIVGATLLACVALLVRR